MPALTFEDIVRSGITTVVLAVKDVGRMTGQWQLDRNTFPLGTALLGNGILTNHMKERNNDI